MTTDDILNSVEIALRVLDERPMRQEDLSRMFAILESAARIVKQRVVDKIGLIG